MLNHIANLMVCCHNNWFDYMRLVPRFRWCVKMQLDFNDLPCHLWRGLSLYPSLLKALAAKLIETN